MHYCSLMNSRPKNRQDNWKLQISGLKTDRDFKKHHGAKQAHDYSYFPRKYVFPHFIECFSKSERHKWKKFCYDRKMQLGRFSIYFWDTRYVCIPKSLKIMLFWTALTEVRFECLFLELRSSPHRKFTLWDVPLTEKRHLVKLFCLHKLRSPPTTERV